MEYENVKKKVTIFIDKGYEITMTKKYGALACRMGNHECLNKEPELPIEEFIGDFLDDCAYKLLPDKSSETEETKEPEVEA